MPEDHVQRVLRTLFHDENARFRTPEEPNSGDEVRLRLRIARDIGAEVLLCTDRGDVIPMDRVRTDDFFDWHEAVLPCPETPMAYSFRVTGEGFRAEYGRRGARLTEAEHPACSSDGFQLLPGFHVPAWAKGALQYQIFPERFRNGDAANDVQAGEYRYVGEPVRAAAWDDPPADGDFRTFYGGDLRGILEKLDYIQSLGVEVIYLNPIFISPSSHKYDTQDYLHIDPHLGVLVGETPECLARRAYSDETLAQSDALFAELCGELHRRGMRIILDGVFNHCGSFHRWMDREKSCGGTGAYHDPDSPCREFFHFDENDPAGYEAWWGFDTLPKLNYENSDALCEEIFAVARKWLLPPYRIDGWRLDVAADLGHSESYNHRFWKEFRRRVRAVNPDALIVAEHFDDPSAWLGGDEWDSVMNYAAFMEPLTHFLTGVDKHSDRLRPELYRDGEAFFQAMSLAMSRMPGVSVACAMNELSNHDHSRFLTRTNGHTGRVGTAGTAAAGEGVDKRVFREAAVVQMTWPGAPTIYYGDEAGLVGWTDPDNRRTYPWGHEDQELIDFHRALAKLRREHGVLRTGSLQPLAAGPGTIAYARFDETACAVIAVNTGEHAVEIPIPADSLGLPDGATLEESFRITPAGYSAETKNTEPVRDGVLPLSLPSHTAVICCHSFAKEEPNMQEVPNNAILLTDFDSYLFHQGTHYEAYRKLGAHPTEENGTPGTRFAVWAPNAQYAAVISARTGWENEDAGRMSRRDDGIWEAFVPWVGVGDAYRYVIVGADGIKRYKSDPFAFYSEKRPANASIVAALDGYRWHDDAFCAARTNKDVLEKPMAIYEVHLGSWKKRYACPGDEDGFLNYRELADQLAEYVAYMGYTHVELIGICEYPFDGSWGYQVTGFFSPTSRYGAPDDFRYFVDKMHEAGIGVILDWVPAHFPKDSFGLENFDGTPLYESADPLRAEYPEWGTKAFDHGKPEVRSFLISSAFYWVREFHVDALRVDAVAAMLYASFSRAEWRPNVFGGNENLESRDFLKQLNYAVTRETPGYLIAEDSSTLSGITTDVDQGGVGFLLKWNMGWMNDTLRYIAHDPIYRKWHHGELTHTVDYAFFENFVLVLSHDEVVHLKHSMVEKAPGSVEDRFGGLKTLYAYQFTHPGKKLLFMGQEFAQDREWSEARELDWWLADDFGHRDVMQCVRNLLSVYRTYPCLYSDSRDPSTFEWVNRNDAWRNTVSFIRRNPWNYDGAVLVVCNFSPSSYAGYTVGVPKPGYYRRVFSTYDSLPGAGNPAEIGGIPPMTAENHDCDGYPCMLTYDLRPFESIIIELPKEETP